MRLAYLLCLTLSLLASTGCSPLKSRYAMEDPVYAEKYAEGAEKGDLVGKAKQALDARHTAGLGGLYVSGGTQFRPESEKVMGGAEIGGEYYLTNWLTARGALAGYANDGDFYGGADLGVRLQTPSRIAPFVGLGTFHGYSEIEKLADRDGIDNDDDGFIDEHKEMKSEIDGWLSVIYPEVGVHWWINGSWRVTGFGRYLISTQGRDQDDWMLGVQLTAFNR